MASILTLKRRIQAAQNVSKTTRAMQMIAASKLRRAQDAALSSRPYVEKIGNIGKNLSTEGDEILHPYLEKKTTSGKTLLLVISPDKGLCGGLVTNLIRELLQFNKDDYMFITVGKKVEHYVAKFEKEIIASFPLGSTLPSFSMVYPLATLIQDHFINGKVDAVSILTTKFQSIFVQKPVITPLLPITLEKEAEIEKQPEDKHPSFQLFEPSVKEILETLLKRYLEMSIYQQLLESFLAEQAARMIAMQNATTNAKDIIEDLRLEYNKTRQAKITSEILDITAGAAAFA